MATSIIVAIAKVGNCIRQNMRYVPNVFVDDSGIYSGAADRGQLIKVNKQVQTYEKKFQRSLDLLFDDTITDTEYTQKKA